MCAPKGVGPGRLGHFSCKKGNFRECRTGAKRCRSRTPRGAAAGASARASWRRGSCPRSWQYFSRRGKTCGWGLVVESPFLASQTTPAPRPTVGLTFSWLAELGCDALELAQRCEAGQRLPLELADALTRQVELVADRLERPRLSLEPEAELEDPPLALGQGVEGPPRALAAKRLLGLVERVSGLAVGEEVAELAFVVGSDGLVQRDGRLGRAEGLVDVLDREAGGFGKLFLRRLAGELDLEPAGGATEPLPALDDVGREADPSWPGSRPRAAPTGGSTSGRRSRTCNRAASRTSRPHG
jgi:hypothetical protein